MNYLDHYDNFTKKHCDKLSAKNKLKTGYTNQSQLNKGITMYKSQAGPGLISAGSIARIFTEKANINLGINLDSGVEQNILRPITSLKELTSTISTQTGSRNDSKNKKEVVAIYTGMYNSLPEEQRSELPAPSKLNEKGVTKDYVGNLIDEMEDQQASAI